MCAAHRAYALSLRRQERGTVLAEAVSHTYREVRSPIRELLRALRGDHGALVSWAQRPLCDVHGGPQIARTCKGEQRLRNVREAVLQDGLRDSEVLHESAGQNGGVSGVRKVEQTLDYCDHLDVNGFRALWRVLEGPRFDLVLI